jgi:hypothetical protein
MLKQINESFKKYSKKSTLHEEFAYKTKHGLGPGMLPRDVRVVDWEEPNDYDTIIYVDRELTPQEMYDYELTEYTDAKECLGEAYNVREFSDMLFDMIENDEIDAKSIAEDLIYWCSEDDIKRYMEVNDIIDIEDYED